MKSPQVPISFHLFNGRCNFLRLATFCTIFSSRISSHGHSALFSTPVQNATFQNTTAFSTACLPARHSRSSSRNYSRRSHSQVRRSRIARTMQRDLVAKNNNKIRGDRVHERVWMNISTASLSNKRGTVTKPKSRCIGICSIVWQSRELDGAALHFFIQFLPSRTESGTNIG